MAWTKAELDLVKSTKHFSEVATETGRTENSIRAKRQKLGIPASGKGEFKSRTVKAEPNAFQETTYVQDQSASQADVWRKRFTELSAKYQRALHQNSVTQQLSNEIMTCAPKSYTQAPAVVRNRPKGGSGSSQSAVLLFSDTHVGQVVSPEQTMGFGCYNFDVFLARLKYLEESVISIIENHMTVNIDELVICMLGDMLHGNLSHAVEAGQHVTLFQQFYASGHAIAQFLRNLAPHVPKIRMKTCVGNHPRWSNQKKMPTENRFSNLDMFMYSLVQALVQDIKTIEWTLDMQPFAIFEVKNHICKASHGDHLKGGDKALGIPNHSIGREISTTAQLFAKHHRESPHYFFCGHLHRGIQLPHAKGEYIINGGFPGLDNYALAENFNPVDPMQRLMFFHSKYGRTAEYPLSLKFAEVTDQRPYVLPFDFAI